ncbi:MAG: hypothetical protein IJL71_02230 [Oscillospiraceae bacterium]|nr:hypothetical protein [Oscillospiraceae bacterium]
MSESVIRLYDGITNIDEDIIEEAEGYVPNVINVNWKRWGALAASLVIIGAGAFGLFRSGLLKPAAGEEVYSTDSTAGQGEDNAPAAMPAEVPAEEPAYEWAEEPAEAPAEDTMEMPVEEKDAVSEETAPVNPILHVDFDPGTGYQAVCYRDIAERYDPLFDEHDPEFIRLDANDITEDDLGEEMGRVTEGECAGCRVYRIGALPEVDAYILDYGGWYGFIMSE